MQSVPQFRVFLSSPGDVHQERKIARNLIDGALSKDPFIRGRATFDPISWDDPDASPGLPAHLTPQEAIDRGLPKPSECDIVIVILWSRLGIPLPPECTREDGSACQSGTEWEFEDALTAADASDRPIILLYRRTEEPRFGARDPKIQEKLDQVAKVDAFFERLKGPDGSLRRTVTSYVDPDAFQKTLLQDLQAVVCRFLGQGFSKELGVAEAAVETMLAILKEQQVPPEHLESKLREIAERHIELMEQLHVLAKSNDPPEITKRRELAAQAIEEGDYEKAISLLEEAVTIDRHAISEHQDALDQRKISAAGTIGQQGELERTRLNYRKAAEHFAEAARLVSTSEADARLDYLMKQALTLRAQGDEFGENPPLIEAIEIYRLVLNEYPREHVPLDWAWAQEGLGTALRTLGARDVGTERLKLAVDAYQAALEEYTRERLPLEWARSQSGLGAALQSLGVRESGTEKLELAVEAYKAALKERRREHVPLYWARTQMNIGSGLHALGARERDTKRLKLAVEAYHFALEEYTREAMPLEWANTQNSLGNTLRILGERESGTTNLEAAVDAYRAALEERARERVPLQWAETKSNLGIVLSTLGERECSTARLEAAIDAYRDALEESTRDRVPLQWAGTQNNLGNALRILGEREKGTVNLEAAVNAYRAALEERTRDRLPVQWAGTQNNLGNALRILGEREKGTVSLEAAIWAYRAALEERTRERMPVQWAWIQENIGLTYWSLAKKSRDQATLLQGIEAIKASLEVYEHGQVTYNLEKAKRNLSDAEMLLVALKDSDVSK